jgi:hypothetical protein
MTHPRTGTGTVVCAIFALFVAGGCPPHPHERLNTPPQGANDVPSEHQASFAYMHDNAMLMEMCLRDMHFVPHQSMLSGLGEARLDRYAELLAECGGTLHYEHATLDKDLIQARLDSARRYLEERHDNGALAITVEVGLSGGRTRADEMVANRSQGFAGFGEREYPMQSAPGGQEQPAGSTTGGGQ